MPVLREPKRRSRSNRKLLALLFLFFMTVLIILFFQSSLSKISTIDIRGNEYIATDTIAKASGVSVGDHFFGRSGTSIERSVATLHMVQSAHVTKRFPGHITIEVQEYPKVAFQIGDDGVLQAVLADGSAATLQNTGTVPDKPLLTGWQASDPLRVKLCQTLAKIPAALFSDISEIRPDPSAGFDDKIKMYTRSQYIVQTTITLLPDKIERLSSIVDNLRENNEAGGVITMLLTDSYAPLGSDETADGSQTATAKDGAKDGAAAAGGGKDADKDAGKSGKAGTKTPPPKK
jgi:cell division protein FtsQ